MDNALNINGMIRTLAWAAPVVLLVSFAIALTH